MLFTTLLTSAPQLPSLRRDSGLFRPLQDAPGSRSASANPRIADVLGDPRHRLLVAPALEELANLVGHVDQPVRRHAWQPPAHRLPSRFGLDA